jgi:hypothetical protein
MREAKRRLLIGDDAIREQFPRGKISRDDNGGVMIGVVWDPANGLVRINFGVPVAWLAMPKEKAAEFAMMILKAAGVTKIDLVN